MATRIPPQISASCKPSLIVRLPVNAISNAPTASSDTTPSLPPKLSTHFTQSQLALAFAIHKARPEGVSISEYILHLRKHIKSGKGVLPESHRYVDCPDFWKEQCEKLHREKNELKQKVSRLEEDRRLLRTGIDVLQPLDVSDVEEEHNEMVLNSRKRPAPPDDWIFDCICGQYGQIDDGAHSIACDKCNTWQHSKCVKISDKEAERHDFRFICSRCKRREGGWVHDQEQQKTLAEERDTVLLLSSHTLRIARQRKMLLQITQDQTHPNRIEELSNTCIQTVALLEAALHENSMPSWSLRCSDDPQTIVLLQQLMHQVDLSFRTCFHALTELCNTILGRQKSYDVIYRLVMFVSKALEYMRKLCNLQGQAEHGAVSKRHNKRAKLQDDEYAVNKYLSRTLVSMTQLEWKAGQPGHSEVLEGILFSILDHTGRLLSNAVFKEHVATSDQNGNITKQDQPMLLEAARLETRYIIPVLHAALGNSTRKELIARVLADNSSGTAAHNRKRLDSQGHDLLFKTRKLLQSSLLKSTVGGEELESLKFPSLPEGHVQFTPLVDVRAEKYGPEWLLESVWALVGWDLATKEG